jgi:hypothetical protein
VLILAGGMGSGEPPITGVGLLGGSGVGVVGGVAGAGRLVTV